MKWLLTGFAMACSVVSVAQQGILSIRFEGTAGVGGPCSDSALASCALYTPPPDSSWSLSGDFSGLTSAADYFKVVGQALEARDIDNRICLETAPVHTGEVPKLNFYAALSESGDLEGSSDFVDVTVIADGRQIDVLNWNGLGNSDHTLAGDLPDDDDWRAARVEVVDFAADSVSARICVLNNSDSERIRVDSLGFESCDTCCGLSGWEVDSVICHEAHSASEANYEVILSYRGSADSVSLVNTGPGDVQVDDTLCCASRGVVRISGIPVNMDWAFAVRGEYCDDTVSGISPFCTDVPGVIISEVDSDQAGSSDTAEFIELRGPVGTALDDFTLVLFNGANNGSYAAIDLAGLQIDDSGFAVICLGGADQDYCDLTVGAALQNGPDGIGLYYGRPASVFPFGSPVIEGGLTDGLRYGTSDPIAETLEILDIGCEYFQPHCQVDEDQLGQKDKHSIQRGSWFVALPTPGYVNVPLPVELVRFDATAHGSEVTLTWLTASETGHDYFAVEQARPREDFAVIGRVVRPVDRGEDGIAHYTYSVRHLSDGPYYYRLRQVDADGSFEYSGVRHVVVSTSAASLFPTMTRGPVQLDWPRIGQVTIDIFDIQGRRILHVEENVNNQLQLNLERYGPGMYLMHCRDHLEQYVFRVLVVS